MTGTMYICPHKHSMRCAQQKMNNKAKQDWVGKLTFERNGLEPYLLIKQFAEHQMNEETNQSNKIFC